MKLKFIYFLQVLLLLLAPDSFALRNESQLHVLITSIPSSHYVPLLPIAEELVKRGHQVTFAFQEKVFKSVPDLPGVKRIILPFTEEQSQRSAERNKRATSFFRKIPDSLSPLLLNVILPLISWPKDPVKYPDTQYASLLSQIQALNEDERPNVILTEFFALYGLDVADKLKINSVLFILLGPEFFSFSRTSPLPKYLLPYKIENQSLFQTTVNQIYQQFRLGEIGIAFWGVFRYIRYNLPMIFDWLQMSENRLVLMNTAPEFSPHDGLPSNFVYVGGGMLSGDVSMGVGRTTDKDVDEMVVKKKSEDVESVTAWLDDKLKSGIDVVYVSFGTVWMVTDKESIDILSGLVTEKIAVLYSLQSASSAEKLLKNTTIPTHLYANVLFKDWVKQKAVLSHPATKAFFTHGGLNSLIESSLLGVPLLCRPAIGDQQYNCNRLADLGAAVMFSRTNVLSSSVVEENAGVLFGEYEMYKQNAERVGEYFRRTGGAKTAVDSMESYFIGKGPHGWKKSSFSVYQRNSGLISMFVWIFSLAYLTVAMSVSIWGFRKLANYFESRKKLKKN